MIEGRIAGSGDNQPGRDELDRPIIVRQHVGDDTIAARCGVGGKASMTIEVEGGAVSFNHEQIMRKGVPQ